MTVRRLAVAASALALTLTGCVTGQPVDLPQLQAGAAGDAAEPLAAVSSVYVNYDNGRVLLRWAAPEDERYLAGYEVLVDGEARFAIRTPDRRFLDLGPLPPQYQHDVTIIPTDDWGGRGEQFTIQVYVAEGAQYPEPRYTEADPGPTTTDPAPRIVVVPAPSESPLAPVPQGPGTSPPATADPAPASTPPSPQPSSAGPYTAPEVVGAAALRCRQVAENRYLHRFSVDLRGGSNWSTQSQDAPEATHIVEAHTTEPGHTLRTIWIASGMGDSALPEPTEEIAVPPILSACPGPTPAPSSSGTGKGGSAEPTAPATDPAP